MPPPWWYEVRTPTKREKYSEVVSRGQPQQSYHQTLQPPHQQEHTHGQNYNRPRQPRHRTGNAPGNSARRQDTYSEARPPRNPGNQASAPPAPKLQPVTTQNRYAPLQETAPTPTDVSVATETPAQPKRRRRRRNQNSQATSEDPRAVIQLTQPSAEACRGYFLPGRVGGHPVSCLVDSGCTITVLSNRIFQRLRPQLKAGRTGRTGVARVADGSTTTTHGEVTLSGQLRHWKFTHTYLIADIQEDILIGIDFLQTHGAALCFRTAELQIGNHKLQCQDADGHPLMARVQITKAVTVPPRSERILPGRLDRTLPGEYFTIEHNTSRQDFLVGTTLSSSKSPPFIRLLNPSDDTLSLTAGRVVALATPADPPEVMEGKCRPQLRQMQQTTGGVPAHMEELYQQALTNCSTPIEQARLQQVLSTYADVFSSSPTDIGHTTLITHSIPTQSDAAPVKQRPRRLGPEKEKEVDRQIKQLQEEGLIEPSHSAWSSPVVMVKKRDGSWRFCVDYRKLNEVTIKDAYPLPRIDDSLDALSGSQYFSTLDLLSGYWQVALDDSAKEKSAFVTRNGLWQWRVLPFGLTSAPSTFERLMERVLRGLHWKNLLIYLDDVVVFSHDVESHLDRLEEVLKRFRAAGLKLKPSKCELFKTHVKYLGHIVSGQGISTDPDKVKAVAEWPCPTNVTEVRAFLGLTGYYRRFVTSYADIARPLHKLTNKEVKFDWGVDAQRAFDTLKQRMIEAPILGYPDPTLPYIVDTDASDEASGGVISQVQNGLERPIAYFSKTFSNEERNYCVTRRELLAVVRTLKQFRPYLFGRPFTLRTDHESLTWMLRLKDPRGQVARWLEEMAEFQYTLQHRRGTSHSNADGLSRRPCGASCRPCQRQLQLPNHPNHHTEETAVQPTDPVKPQVDTYAEKTAMRPTDPVTPTTVDTAEQPKDPATQNSALQPISQEQLRLLRPIPEVIKLQQTESPVDRVYRAVKLATPITDLELQEASPELKQWHRHWEFLSLREDGILQVQITKNQRRLTVVACPPSLRRSIIVEAHQTTHLGEWKTTKLVQQNWFWPGLSSEVRRIVKACETCQSQKNSGTQQPGTKYRLYSGKPWQRVAVDFTGPLDPTPRGNKWILVITDHFTRWADAIPLPNATAATVAETLTTRVFNNFGVPEILHSDQGRQFESDLMYELCKLWGVEKTRTAPYRPQANGICERLNRTLGDGLRSLLHQNEASVTDWDLLLPHIMQIMRSTPHKITGETANFLMLGREIRLPALLTHDITTDDQQVVSDYAIHMKERLNKAHALLRQQQLTARTQDSEEPPLFKEGDQVWLKSYQKVRGKTAKLQPKFVGPYLVNEALPYHTYRLTRNGRETIQHEGRIKLHIVDNLTTNSVLPREGPRSIPPTKRQTKINKPEDPIPFPLESRGGRYSPVALPEYYPSTLEITSLPDSDIMYQKAVELSAPTLAIENGRATPELENANTENSVNIELSTPVAEPELNNSGAVVGTCTHPTEGYPALDRETQSRYPKRWRSAPYHMRDYVS